MDSKNRTLNSYPRILIVGEAPVSPNLAGSAQTIYNLFSKYPPDKIFSVSSDYTKSAYGKDSLIRHIVFVKTSFIPSLRNRLGFLVNGLINKINYKLRAIWPLEEISKILAFDPEVVVLCPNINVHLLCGMRIVRKLNKPFLVYYMDDWMKEQENADFYNIRNLAAESLQNSAGWMMISKELQQILAKRYKVNNKPFIVVQNPVEVVGTAVKEILATDITEGQSFEIVYAGSIWDMHFDALENFAKAVKKMRVKGINVTLIIYTFQHFWEKYSSVFGNLEVRYGGELKYAQVAEKLKLSDAHLVTSSFKQEWESHSQASVQTKITDYMASGKPVISYGPEYSACHRFIKEWKAGYVFTEKDTDRLAGLIGSIINKEEERIQTGLRNIKTIEENFSSSIVCPKLYEFISETLTASK